jgi:hypothetical protein
MRGGWGCVVSANEYSCAVCTWSPIKLWRFYVRFLDTGYLSLKGQKSYWKNIRVSSFQTCVLTFQFPLLGKNRLVVPYYVDSNVTGSHGCVQRWILCVSMLVSPPEGGGGEDLKLYGSKNYSTAPSPLPAIRVTLPRRRKTWRVWWTGSGRK